VNSPRILLFTGKGGVGKTTVATATALRAGTFGYRTLVLSADPAHSLADALDRPLGPEPVQVEPKVYAQEVDVYHSLQKYWEALRDFILQVFSWQKVDEILAEELALLPGMEEVAALLWVDKFYREGEFDLIIIDSAPTGETLTLLSLPQVGQWWMQRIFPIQRRLVKTVGPVVRTLTGMPMPRDEAYEEVENLYEQLLKIHKVLCDPEVSSIRLVLNPERMVIHEARRSYTYFQLYGYPVDAAIVNRILPEESADPLFRPYLEAQRRYLREIEEAFAPLPTFRVPHLGQEVFGIPLLRELGERLYGEKDPAEILFKEKPYRFSAQDGAYLLEIHLPFLGKEEVSALQYGDELVIQVRNQRVHLFLPRFLAYYSVTGAHLEDGWLRVRFEKPQEAEEA